MVPNMSDEEAVHKFIYGLKPRIREMVQISEPESLNEAMSRAMNVDDIHYTQNIRNYS